MEKNIQETICDKNHLTQLSFPHEHIKGSGDEWKCIVLNPIKNLHYLNPTLSQS